MPTVIANCRFTEHDDYKKLLKSPLVFHLYSTQVHVFIISLVIHHSFFSFFTPEFTNENRPVEVCFFDLYFHKILTQRTFCISAGLALSYSVICMHVQLQVNVTAAMIKNPSHCHCSKLLRGV